MPAFINKPIQYCKKMLFILSQRKRGVKIHLKAEINKAIFEPFAMISHHASVNQSTIGAYTSIGRYTKINFSTIGAFCSISWDVTIGATEHPSDHLSTHAFPYVPYAGGFTRTNSQHITRTEVGNDVWIGCNSVILPGVKISNGAVIGAGAVVTKDVPPYAIVAGVPAKVVKYRFDLETIERLNDVNWWNWSREKITENIDLFQQRTTLDLIEEMTRRGLIEH